MRVRIPSRWLTPALVAGAVAIAACQDEAPRPPGAGGRRVDPVPQTLDRLGAQDQPLLKAYLDGLGAMERYEYGRAAEAFRVTVKLDPGSDAAKINLAIALLNDTGVKAEESKKGGAAVAAPAEGGSGSANFDEALDLLNDVLAHDPDNLHAHYCRGIILEYIGRIAEAHADFQFVTERDPSDANAWLKYGSTLPDPARPGFTASLKQAPELIEIYTRAVERNPYQVVALYKLQEAYNWLARTTKNADAAKQRDEVSALWRRLDPNQNVAGSGDPGKTTYGELGRYATVISLFPRNRNHADDLIAPRFEAPTPLRVDLPAGHRWAQKSDFAGDGRVSLLGRVRERFGVPTAHLDVDGDGKLDLFLAAAVIGPEGPRDVLLRNQGDGRFEDVSAGFGLPVGRASVGLAAADFDADGRIDLFLAGLGANLLLRNQDGKGFEDVTATLGDPGPPALTLTGRWLDLDQDGDLDLIAIRYTGAEHADRAFVAGAEPVPGITNAVYRNDGQPPKVPNVVEQNYAPAAVAPEDLKVTAGLSLAFKPWEGPDAEALHAGAGRHTGLAALDLDDDRDLDVVLFADGVAPLAALNDRLGRFRGQTLGDLNREAATVNGAAVVDLNRDGRSDLALVHPDGKLGAWLNVKAGPKDTKPGFGFEFWPVDAKAWRGAIAADVDLDTWTDLIGLPAPGGESGEAPAWARNEGHRLATTGLALGPDGTAPLAAVDWADLVGDPLPDALIVRDGEGPKLARNLGNGQHWLALDLSGRWKFGFDFMRTNPHGLGTRLNLEGPGLDVPYAVTTPGSGLAQSIGPVVLGLGRSASAALLRLRWPDGVMQAELNVPGDQVLSLAEYNRKTGSCPVLFTFDGRRFACIGDFLGGGGLGYLVAPGEYSQPDRDEAVAIGPEQLRPVNGSYRIAITEPMDELAYLDRVELEVVDRPPGVEAAPDERFAPGGNRPTGQLWAWSRTITPVKATDQAGTDVTDRLRAFDRLTVDTFTRRRGWIGYAEEHGITLDFGDRLANFGPDDRLVLGLAGWVEYPYSQTNYAAATAGVALQPPVLERRREDGTWEVLEADPGYPAGLPRLTTLELTGKLLGPSCVLRLRTNMECYYDQAFIAVAAPAAQAGVRTTTLPVSRAVLGYRGYSREVSPDGRLPLLYDYDKIDPAPLERLEGKLTRYGDVAALLTGDDDRFCIVGPGDEAAIEFDASPLPPLPEGWTRSFVLRSVGYCKDADPFTAASDTVGPLPWKGMPPYPFGPEGERPRDPAHDAYLRQYQTRSIAR